MVQRGSCAFSTKYAADIQRRASVGKYMKLLSVENQISHW